MRSQGFEGADDGQITPLRHPLMICHIGDIPSYPTVLTYLPERDAALPVSVNAGAPKDQAARQITVAVTAIVTLDHLYDPANA
ncbi:MAG: hypothetical protein ACSLFA_07300 [Mycobacterium sp.]